MEKLHEDIKAAIDFVNRPFESDHNFYTYSTPFLFTTESQEGVAKAIDYNDKKVLTVASSGDQYLGAMYYGAKDVSLFDVNRLTYYISYLKIAAIKFLPYHQFIDFFVPHIKGKMRPSFLNREVFAKLMLILPDDVAQFWERVIFEINRRKQFGNLLLTTSSCNEMSIIKNGMPFYASEEEYYKLQNILKSKAYPKFNEMSILKLDDLVEEFDVLYLSNIIECLVMEDILPYTVFGYMPGIEDKVENDKLMELGPVLFKVLKENGTIMMDYRSNKDLKDSTDLLFNNDFFEVTEVPSKIPSSESNNPYSCEIDSVLTYTPSKTGYYTKKK